jgi:hypothetical protein
MIEKKSPIKRLPTSPKILAHAAVNWGGVRTSVLRKDLIQEPTEAILNGNSILGRDWIHFFDPQYSFLKGLIASVITSPTLLRIISDKTTLANGQGYIPYLQNFSNLIVTGKAPKQKAELTDAQLGYLSECLENVNIYGENFHDVISKLLFDYFSFGNAYAEMRKTTVAGVPKVQISHLELYTIAQHKNPDTNVVSEIAVRDDWGASTGQEVKKLPMYPNWTKQENGDEVTVIRIKNYIPGYFYWGMPSWLASQFYAELEYRIPKYNIGKMDNGYVPSSIVQFFGNVSQEEAKKVIDRFTEKFTGVGNNSKIFAQVLSDERLKANVQKLEDNSEGNYLDLQKISAQGIVTGSQWSMSLAGFATGGQLGTNQQVKMEYEYSKNTCIIPAQIKAENLLITPFLKAVLSLAGNQLPQNLVLGISTAYPLTMSESVDINTILSEDELRQVVGYAPKI